MHFNLLHRSLFPSELCLCRCRLADACPPVPLDLSHDCRVDDQVPERLDRRHVGGPEQSVWLYENGHLAAVAAGLVWDPAEVQDPVHCAVGDLRGELVLEPEVWGELVDPPGARGVRGIRKPLTRSSIRHPYANVSYGSV